MPDNQEVFKKISTDIKTVNAYIDTAHELIQAMKEVGQDTTEQEQTLRQLIKQKTKWDLMLKNKGY